MENIMKRVSIAMATYNGELYIRDQLNSILNDITRNDEIVISDDGSSDMTIEIIKEYQRNHPNIFLFKNPKKGVFTNFENAIRKCNNDIIFLSDQDDIWIKGKKNAICKCFDDSKVNVVLHNAIKYINEREENSKIVRYKKGVFINILRSGYWGCCMAFRKEFINQFLPFNIENGLAHDQLIGLLGEFTKSSFYLNKVLIKHRIHDHNVTQSKGIKEKVYFRIKLYMEFKKTIERINQKE